jgi:hypothetical protein
MTIEIDVKQFDVLASKYPVIVDTYDNHYVVVDGILFLEVITKENVTDGDQIK